MRWFQSNTKVSNSFKFFWINVYVTVLGYDPCSIYLANALNRSVVHRETCIQLLALGLLFYTSRKVRQLLLHYQSIHRTMNADVGLFIMHYSLCSFDCEVLLCLLYATV